MRAQADKKPPNLPEILIHRATEHKKRSSFSLENKDGKGDSLKPTEIVLKFNHSIRDERDIIPGMRKGVYYDPEEDEELP